MDLNEVKILEEYVLGSFSPEILKKFLAGSELSYFYNSIHLMNERDASAENLINEFD